MSHKKERAMGLLRSTVTSKSIWTQPEVDTDTPRTPDALAQQGVHCQSAGASVLNMHAENLPSAIVAAYDHTEMSHKALLCREGALGTVHV